MASRTSSASEPPASAKGPAALKMLIASSGDAETDAVKAAADAWAKKTGNTVTVTVASDMQQQLAQGFASGSPADVFYMDAARFADYAKNGSLYPYADQVSDNDDFYESLRQTFTYEGKQYCIPKDFSTLALQINTDSWTKAGLTDADIPTTWDQLEAVSKKLTTKDQVGLGIGVRHRPARRVRRADRRVVAQRGRLGPGGEQPRRSPRRWSGCRRTSRPATSRCPTSSTPAGAARRSAPGRPR